MTGSSAIIDTAVPALVYPGRPFHRDESLLFFGREEHVDELLARLEDTTFLAVVGLSGSGKSSLVFAGLVPALERGHLAGAGAAWKVAAMRPGSDPLAALLTCLNRALGPAPERGAQLRAGPLGLIQASITGRAAGENLLLVVDQFEEIFRFQREHKEKAHEAAEFVRLLLAATQEYGARLYVVLTMRSDYLGDCSRFPGLPEVLNGSQYLTPRLTREQAREAIQGPAALAGVTIEPELLERLLDETTDRRDQLPILQHLLMRMWKARAGGARLTRKEFDAVGGRGALNRHVQQTYEEAPNRALARRVFQCLTDISEGGRENRRPRKLAELAAETGASEAEVAATVEHFRAEGRGFLTSPDAQLVSDSVIDIQHESLIREWTELRKWARQEADSGKWYQRVEDRARVGRGRVFLVDDELTAALKARSEGAWNPAWSLRYAGKDGLGYDDVVGLLEESKRQDIEVKKRTRRRWWTLVALTVVSVMATVAALLLFRTTRSLLESSRQQNEKLEQMLRQLQEAKDEITRLRNPAIAGESGTDLPITRLGETPAAQQGLPPCPAVDPGPTGDSRNGEPIGLSLHFGVNRVNKASYGGWDGVLPSTIPDAQAMQKLASSLGYRSTLYTDAVARTDCLGAALTTAASALRSGDFLLITISGNGSQIDDASGNEPDKKIETWVLFDSQVTSADLFEEFAKFRAGVTLIVVQDLSFAAAFRRPEGVPELSAGLVVLAGTSEDQWAMDGPKNGAFTTALLSVWNGGRFEGTYTDFIGAVGRQMRRGKTSGSPQLPQLYIRGPNADLAAMRPFRMSPPG
jgi:hypothetical protein